MTDRIDPEHTDVPAAPDPDLDEELDEALDDSFPASDPVSIDRREDPQ
ncbi:MAG: hypothetical protein ACK4NU_02050 [Brevundimonas sp.]|jgi:hypothetical protein